MKKRDIWKKKRTLLRWMGSYLVILIFPVIFGSIIYLVALQNVQKEMEEVQYQKVRQTVNSLKLAFQNMEETSNTMLNDSIIKSIGALEQYQVPHYHYISSSGDEIRSMITGNQNIENFYLYFTKSGYLLNGSSWFSGEDSTPTLQMKIGFHQEQLFGLRDGGNYRTMQILSVGGHQNLVLIHRQITGSDQPDVISLLYADMSLLRQKLQIPNSDTYLVDSAGNWIADNLGSKPKTGPSKTNGYYTVEIPIEEYGLSVINIFPGSMFYESLRELWHVLAAYLLLCGVVGICLAWSLAKWNYNPLDQLMKKVKRSGQEENSPHNEFEILEQTLENLRNENRYINQYLRKQEEAAHNYTLSAALKGRSSRLRLSGTEASRLGLPQNYLYYQLLVFEIENCDNLFFEENLQIDNDVADTIYFMIRNVVEEQLHDQCDYYCGEVDGNMVCLLNIETAENTIDLSTMAESICHFFQEKAGLALVADISELHEGEQALTDCYQEVSDMMEFRDVIGTDKKILYSSDITAILEGNGILIQQSEKNAAFMLQNHRYDDAIQILTHLKELEAERDTPVTTNNAATLLGNEIIEYVREHYQDPNLSAGLIADKFQIGRSYLSQLFKKCHHIGMLEYINYYRVEQSKTLLCQGINVKQSAEQVGYYNVRPFIRAFKQWTGMTPGEWQKLHKGSSTEISAIH